jgi:biofilm PGA synthesis N-glycosyltransferase PgaC
MTGEQLSYAVVTPVRDEVDNLPRLARCVESQTVTPRAWLIVDTGSTDSTLELAGDLAARLPWAELKQAAPADLRRGAPIVRAFHMGVDQLRQRDVDVVVKVDADVSFEADHFQRLLEAFRLDPRLGIASGSVWELQRGSWRQLFSTGNSVWGAARAYRWSCLEDVLPLEERMGWDGVDELKANVRGWTTRSLLDLPVRHHRQEGGRDRSRLAAWSAQGELAWFMGYRPSYLFTRALYRALREPAAAGMISGYVKAAVERVPRLSDDAAVEYLRRQQRVRELPARALEAMGRGSGRSRGREQIPWRAG